MTSLRNEKMTEIVGYLLEQQDRMQTRFDGWTEVQEGIAGRHTAIEFRKAGTITCNLLDNNRLGREKAVDVKLASDLIALKDIYDIAVIVSGDAGLCAGRSSSQGLRQASRDRRL